MNITAEQYRQMSRYERAMIAPRRYDTLLWLESLGRLSAYGQEALANHRQQPSTTANDCKPRV